MFLRLIEEKEKNIVMIPINHLYIKETESGTKITKYINKTSEINSIEFVSSLNTFIWFKVSFVSMSVANNFIKTIEHIMGIKDIRKQYDFGEVIGKGGGFAKVKKLQDKKIKLKNINDFYVYMFPQKYTETLKDWLLPRADKYITDLKKIE